MNESDTVRSALVVVRREWWVVALAVVAAVGVAAVVGRGQTTYVGTANMLIDAPDISRYKGLPLPDDVLRQSTSAAWQERFAQAAGVSKAGIVSGLRVSSAGNPANRLVITYVSPDKAQAEAVAGSVASEITKLAQEMAKIEIDFRKQRIGLGAEATSRILKLEGANKFTPAEQAIDAFNLYDIRQRSSIEANELAILLTAYSLDGEPTVAARSGVSGLAATMVGAVLVGLFVGLLAAAAREAMMRRSASPPEA